MDIRTTPKLSGNTETDIKNLSEWCDIFRRKIIEAFEDEVKATSDNADGLTELKATADEFAERITALEEKAVEFEERIAYLEEQFAEL